MTVFNDGKPYHGSSIVEGGKLTGATGRTDYFFFLCPRCGDSQILQISEYEVRQGEPKFVLAFHLHCPECGFDDFAKLGNDHRADKLAVKSVGVCG